jgi:DNA-binding response OmpR family regulator
MNESGSGSKKILVVDNESDINYTLQSILEDNGFIVDTYTDPVLALRNFQASLYDLILLDIKMPDMDGFELYNKMREIDDRAKICFLTASEMFYEDLRKEHFKFSESLGERYFIQKPCITEELLRRINEMIKSDSNNSSFGINNHKRQKERNEKQK